MVLTWEAIGVLVAIIAGICTLNAFVSRAFIRQEFDKFQAAFRPIGECRLLHNALDQRLHAVDVASQVSIALANPDRRHARADQKFENDRLDRLENK
jgi:hypothetical protein